jgi:hypothetical protein
VLGVDELPTPLDDELPFEIDDEPDPPVPDEVLPPALRVLLEPGCSWATTTPMTTVMPVAASTATRVTMPSRVCARPRDSGVWGWLGRDM